MHPARALTWYTFYRHACVWVGHPGKTLLKTLSPITSTVCSKGFEMWRGQSPGAKSTLFPWSQEILFRFARKINFWRSLFPSPCCLQQGHLGSFPKAVPMSRFHAATITSAVPCFLYWECLGCTRAAVAVGAGTSRQEDEREELYQTPPRLGPWP